MRVIKSTNHRPMTASEKANHSDVRGFRNSEDASNDRTKALKQHANQCCPCPLPGGFACGQCLSCQLILNRTCQEDGLKDDWCEYFEDRDEICIRAMDTAFIYDFETPPLLPGQVGAIYTEGVSQVAIFRPAAPTTFGVPTYPTLSIVTLFSPTFTDFPTPASLAAGEFAIYLPYGSPITSATPAGTTFGLDDVDAADIAVFSTSYASLADVPYYLMNTMYDVFGVSTATTTSLVGRSIKMYRTGWLLQTDRVMNSTTTSAADATQQVLRIANIITPLGYWQLESSGMRAIYCLRRKYVRALYTCHKRCHCCTDNPSRGCNGSRCGVVKTRVMFTRDNPVANLDDPEAFLSHPSDLVMLERALHEDDHSFCGLTVHPKSFRLITSAVGDNLAFVPKWVLRKALKLAKKREREIEVLPSVEAEVNNEGMVRYMSLIAAQQQQAFKTSLEAIRMAKLGLALEQASPKVQQTTPVASAKPILPKPTATSNVSQTSPISAATATSVPTQLSARDQARLVRARARQERRAQSLAKSVQQQSGSIYDGNVFSK